MFYKDSINIYHARPLDEFEWLVHGFGTRWSESLGACRNLATLHQIHSNRVLDAAGRSGCLGDGDALVENTPGALVGVKTADCLPILLVDPRRRAVAAVHAGWRGAVQKIAARVVAEMHSRFSSRAADLHAAIGPGIGECCYEVGPEVGSQFQQVGDLTHPIKINLAEINRNQLVEAGIPEGQIYTAGICTMCNPEFYSYRRDQRHAGRMLSVVGIR